MALKLPIKAGAAYKITYRANATSGGTTLLAAFWIPKDGAKVPEPEDRLIAAGSTDDISGKVPPLADVRRVEIRVDLPDGVGTGTLTLEVNGKVHSAKELSGDETWTSIVVAGG
jgi:hypothetical protein